MSAAASSRVRFRRAVALLLMTLVLPGSAQLVAGNKRWGRLALRLVGLLAFTALVLVVVAKFWPVELSALLFDATMLTVLRVLLVLAAAGWAALFVDAWRIGDPLGLGRRQRLAVFSLNGALCVVVSGALLFGSHLVSVQRSLVTDIFGHGITSDAEDGRYNVLLLGGDAGVTREGLRPDSMTVASIDEDTGRTVLFSLPRNLEDVPFPDGTPMHRAFPEGFDCEGCYLNSVYTWATDHADLFPAKVGDVGAYATKRTVEEVTGLTINYYAMVDLRGFRDLVDAVGGVTLTVPERLPIGGVDGPIRGWVAAGRHHLDGFHTLWFARSRRTSDDYSRMARQKCVMSAMLDQLSPRDVLTRFQDIATASKEIVTTDVPADQINTFLDLANKARRLPVASVSFVPPTIETYDPDFDQIQSMVQAGIDRSEQADDAYDDETRDIRDTQDTRAGRDPQSPTAAQGAASGGGGPGGAGAQAAEAANDTDVLADAC
jgi:polyisoprenyl-teichoic acid--peptidoglycan teichoic acid transferase